MSQWINPNPDKPFQIDLACGDRKKDDHVGVDIVKTASADYAWDLTKSPWPLEDASVDELHCSHFFEHMDGTERIAFMEECWRVLKINKNLIIQCPHWSSMRAIQDPTHKWPPVAETSFLYFNRGWRVSNKLDHYPIKCNFDFGYGFFIDPDVQIRNEEYQRYAAKHLVNAIMDINVTLTKRE